MDTSTFRPAPGQVNSPTPLARVPFRGGFILAASGPVDQEGNRPVPLAPFCEALGIDTWTQTRKLNKVAWTCTSKMLVQIPGDDQAREVVTIPLRALAGWLFTINASKVKPEARPMLEAFQAEACDVLYRHFLAPSVGPGGPSWAQLAADVASLRNEVRQLAHGRRRLSDHDTARARAFCEGRTDVTPLEVMTAGLGWELPDETEIRAVERLLKALGFTSTWRRPRFVRCNETARWTRVATLPQRCA